MQSVSGKNYENSNRETSQLCYSSYNYGGILKLILLY
jgi:hypothetical protein